MKDIEAIINSGKPASDVVSFLKNKYLEIPSWDKLVKLYEPSRHKIVDDKVGRKDKVRKDGIEVASRIFIGLEKLLTRRMTEFMFAIPVKRVYHNIEGNEVRQRIASAIEAIYKYARMDSENIRRGNAYFAACEVLTVWYTVPQNNTLYGFDSKWKLKCKTYSPMDGVSLYPMFDEFGDMKAMSIEYSNKIDGKKVIFFDTYTAVAHHKWKLEDGVWEKVPSINPVETGKIPGIYIWRQEPIYHPDLSYIRNEIEYTLSRNSDVIAYNSAPILKVAGSVQGGENKGESRRVYRVKEGGDVDYVSWAQSIEALKFQVDTLMNLFWSQAQMPDISFEKMKSLGNIGFDARQTLLTDAHLKVGDESGAWIEFFERETSVIKSFLGQMKKDWAKELDNVEVEHIITPFIQKNEKDEIERRMSANGGKPIESHIESIRRYGRSPDPAATLEQIRKEEAETSAQRMSDIFEHAE